MTILVFDAGSLAPFEIGARLDALLCYPTWSGERQQKLSDAICAAIVAYSIELDPSRKGELWGAYPQYKKSRSRTALDSLPNRREKALNAGRAFLPLLKKAVTGKLPILKGQQRELSRAEIARFLWPPRENGDEINYEDRLHDRMKELRGYYGIAHLAAAYQYMARERSGPNEAAPLDYQDIDFHREVVRRATDYAAAFRAIPALKGIAKELVELEWCD